METTLLSEDTGPGGLTSSPIPFSLARCLPQPQGGGWSGSENIFISLLRCLCRSQSGCCPRWDLVGGGRRKMEDGVGDGSCAKHPDPITSLHSDPQWSRRTAAPRKGLEGKEGRRRREARLPGAWPGAGSVLGPGLTALNGKCFARTQNHRVRERWHWEPLSDLPLQAQRSRHVSFSNGGL